MSVRSASSFFLPRSKRAVRRIVALAALILVVVTAGALALLFYAAASVNQVQVSEERGLVTRRLERSLEGVITDITSASVWDDAYERLGPGFDAEWADINIGGYYADYLDHDVSLVLDGGDRPVYAWRGEARVEAGSVARFLRDAEPLIRRLRQNEAAHFGHPAWKPYGLDAALEASGVLRSEGRYYLVGVTRVVPETSAARLRPGPAPLVVSAEEMDAGFLAGLDKDLGLTEAHFAPRSVGTVARVPLIDINGRDVGYLTWTPKRPGADVLRQAVPIFASALMVLLAAGAALALHIRAVLRELTANDSALKRTMDELVRARDQADLASIAKSQFLANMSHEIRTPLNGILGMAQVMARDDLSPAQRERLDIVRGSGQALLALLNDILDISKIEAGRLEMDQHEFDLAEMVHGVCDPFAALAVQKDIGFRIEIDDEARGLWWGDGLRLGQAIGNLVSNAVKFTLQGEVRVSVVHDGEGLSFAVEDTGIGIAADRAPELFKKFSQMDASTTRRFGGTGLGLAISRELVELMGGRLEMESRTGEGSRFTFRLPLEWCGPERGSPDAAVEPDPAEEGRPLRILAAEDNPTNRLILSALLEPTGANLRLVGDGLEAVDAYRDGDFDLVLMDIQMPRMNGVEATLEIRRLEAAHGRPVTPILAVSANVMNHQVTEYLEAGMTGAVSKPIEVEKLVAAIEQALAEPGRNQAA